MAQPEKPIEAQGLGCGLVISLVGTTALLMWLGLPPGPSVLVAVVLAGLSIVAYMVNQYKAQRILDDTYRKVTSDCNSLPVATRLSAPIEIDGEGKYRVRGVDRATGMIRRGTQMLRRARTRR
jgi:hypothetical protein